MRLMFPRLYIDKMRCARLLECLKRYSRRLHEKTGEAMEHRVGIVPRFDAGAQQAAEVLALVVQTGGISELQQAQTLRTGTGLHGTKLFLFHAFELSFVVKPTTLPKCKEVV